MKPTPTLTPVAAAAGRSAGNQSSAAAAACSGEPARFRSQSAAQIATPIGSKLLLTYTEVGQLLGVSERKAYDIVAGLVDPVVLGPRCTRILRSELEAALAKLPRQTAPTEPHQLLRGKVERLKRTGTAA
jgi:hypothetical protein